MARYIDADLVIADLQRYLCANCSIHCNPISIKNSACDIAECLRMTDNAPTADVEPVRHGQWDELATFLICSKCKKPFKYQYSYCPSCGAKMDEEAENESE